MGAVFTIFLLVPLFLPVIAADSFLGLFGIDIFGGFEQIAESITAWLQANPETSAAIGEGLMDTFEVIKKVAEIADSILIS